MRRLIACLFVIASVNQAFAINDTIGVTAGTGKTANLIAFAGGNVISETGICDATTANQCAAVSAGGALSIASASGAFASGSFASGAFASGSHASGSFASGAFASGSVASGAYASGSIGSGAMVDLGSAGATHQCTASSGSTTVIACLGQIDDDIKGAVAAGTNRIGYVSDDPCNQLTKSGAPINLTASGQVITGTSAKKTYICSIDLVSATAQNIALVEGTGTVCATNIFGLAGGTSAATGWNFAANGGLTKGSGAGSVYSPSADTNGTAANVCLLLSSSGQTSGHITYVQQ